MNRKSKKSNKTNKKKSSANFQKPNNNVNVNTINTINRDNNNDHLSAEKKRLESELLRESSLITQAGLATAAFSFSSTALFTVWRVGITTIKNVPKGVIHICIGIITSLLLFSMYFSINALLQSKYKNYREDYSRLKNSNDRRYENIRISIILWRIAFFLVFLVIVFLFLTYYYLPGKIRFLIN